MQTGSINLSTESDWEIARRLTSGGMLSIIMPAHNLEKHIAANISQVADTFNQQGIRFEIIAVDDGSADKTAGEISQLAEQFPAIHLIHLKQNSGKGAALKRGFQASTGNFVLFLDADLDLPPSQAGYFFSIMSEANADVVIGCKMHPDSNLTYPFNRRLMSRAYFKIVKALLGLPVRDTQTGIKLFKRAALEAAFPRMLVKQFAVDLEMLAIIHEFGFRISEAPVILDFHQKDYPFRFSTIVRIALDTMAIFYRTRLLGYYKSLPWTSMPSPAPLVSIIVACPSSSDYLKECISAVQQQNYNNFEVIILPDLPTGQNWNDCRIREIPTGALRPAEKRNIGINNAKGSICAFLDDDAFPMEDWLHNALMHFSDCSVGAAGGPAVTPNQDPLAARISGRVYSNPLVSGKYRYRYTPDRVRDVEDFPSCNLLVRTGILKELSGFRTDFWPGEDTYLCMDIIKKCSKRIVYDPRIMAYHHRRKVFLPHLRQIARYALHRGYFARRFPATSRKLAYAVPSLFVLGLISGGILSLIWPPLRAAYIISVAVYAGITFLYAFSANPLYWLLTWLGIITTHIVYGIRFIIGFFSAQMPETVAAFDHPSEAAARD